MTSRLFRRYFSAVYVLLLCAVPSQSVHAGGMEYTGPGTVALGRGGAVTARADNPMVLDYNPAGLAELRGTQLLADVNLAFFSACVDPIGYYGWGTYNPSAGGGPSRFKNPNTGQEETLYLGIGPDYVASGQITQADYDKAMAYYNDPLDTVCMKQVYLPIPQFVITTRISENLGLGAGLVFPAQQPVGAWGGEDGVIIGRNGDVRPSPVRYMLLESSQLALFPTIGVGYRLPGLDRIRLGLALQWGMITVTQSAMVGSSGGTTPRGDARYEMHGKDLFVPAVIFSTHFVPIDAVDIVLAGKWQDDLDASGNLNIETGIFDPSLTPLVSKVKVNSIHQNMPWKLRGGIRFADRIVPRPKTVADEKGDETGKSAIRDPLSDELWDVEVDVEFQYNSRNQYQKIDYPTGEVIWIQGAANKTTGVVPERKAVVYPAPITVDGKTTAAPTIMDKRWKDQFSIRAGGTYNVLRGILAISAGVHWENRGVDPNYMQLDFWPVSRLGLHGGVIVRLFRSIDLAFSYAHIFQEDIVVQSPSHLAAGEIYRNVSDPSKANTVNIDKSVGVAESAQGRVVVEETPVKNPDGTASIKQTILIGTSGMPQWITNAGTYRSSYNVIAAGMNVHF